MPSGSSFRNILDDDELDDDVIMYDPNEQDVLDYYGKKYRPANIVSVIDGNNDSKIRDITVGRFPKYMTPDDNKIFVLNSGSGTVSIIDTTSDKKEPNDIVVGNSTSSCELSLFTCHPIASIGDHIYVANTNNGTVSLFSEKLNKKIDETAVGKIPTYIAVDPFLGRIFILNHGS